MYTPSPDTSCSDCRREVEERRWTLLLTNWLNKIVYPHTLVQVWDEGDLEKVLCRYKDDLQLDVTDYHMITTDVDNFVKCKYPIFRLRFYTDEYGFSKRLYLLASVVLYHCCVHSQGGAVDRDISEMLDACEQEMIIKYCETLSQMEITCFNVITAIREACMSTMELYNKMKCKTYPKTEKRSYKTCESADPHMDKMLVSSDDSAVETKCDAMQKFRSLVTVLPSAIVSDHALMEDSDRGDGGDNVDSQDQNIGYYYYEGNDDSVMGVRAEHHEEKKERPSQVSYQCRDDQRRSAQCSSIDSTKPDMSYAEPGPPASSKLKQTRRTKLKCNWYMFLIVVIAICLVLLFSVLSVLYSKRSNTNSDKLSDKIDEPITIHGHNWSWQCRNNVCHKILEPTSNDGYPSLSRCNLICTGPLIWPKPVREMKYNRTIVELSTSKLTYKFRIIPSINVREHLAEAFKLFIVDLTRLERTYKGNKELKTVSTMIIAIDVDLDPDARLRLTTDESYTLKIDTIYNEVHIQMISPSFCGITNALETLKQLILIDYSTGYLITYSEFYVRDIPSYKYRGLMIDTARNYIPMKDLMRTIDAMAMCKLNTFHWRISDATSFPLLLPKFEEGAYDSHMVYSRRDVKILVHRAAIKGIRVLIEVAAPSPVGKPWMWADNKCSKYEFNNEPCTNVLCTKLLMTDAVYDTLRTIYAEVINLTEVNDVFHLSGGAFSLANCPNLTEDRVGFYENALESLRQANKGLIPKLPIVWFTENLKDDADRRVWFRYGVQLSSQGASEGVLEDFRVIQSDKWDLSCEVAKKRCKKYRSWQEMYLRKSWRYLEAFVIEGGESVLWTDLVDAGNLDYHLWPRAAAVAERLWSDPAVSSTLTPDVYVRLEGFRRRLLLSGARSRPLWPAWCTLQPAACYTHHHDHKH